MTVRSPVKVNTVSFKEWMTATLFCERNRYPTTIDG